MILSRFATYTDGVLKPDTPLDLPAGTRVQLTIEADDAVPQPPPMSWEEFEQFMDKYPIDSGGERLTRDQLHERR